ncbi:hypothetical protein Cni_G28815 [Canna indica]|uniref:HSF-type DNA-binding domain-containing protein n=1 Tax=Canna indica TaxID=4628 RepID=A0AAQ3L3F1_9LILI|nr:hypothetical protein Cni_G28815 [Canna indica]
MGFKRSGGGEGGGEPAPFLVKTYEMVEEKETEEVISWGEKGESFVVWKPVEFACDLLPLHFKHNNFSSFVRQLNTYGFRKVVPDRWEFTNDNFRRGEQSLLYKIRRRGPPPSTPRLPSADKPSAPCQNMQLLPPPCTSNSVELHSSSCSSPPPANHLRQLVNENEKLRIDNHVLNTELSQAKCRFHELLSFLSKYVDVSKLDFGLLMEAEEGEEEVVEKEQGVKLFGVLLKKKSIVGAKRRRCEGSCGDVCDGERSLKMMSFALPWMGMATPLQREGSKVCN